MKKLQSNSKVGKIFIFSAPSGSGKTTIVRYLLDNNSDLGFSISACTRNKRGHEEVHGRDYYFLTRKEFKEKIGSNEFIEWEEVYDGNYYGTLKSEVQRLWSIGKNVIFDVDVQGGINLKKYFADKALSVFVKVVSKETLRKRLEERKTETEETLAKRLDKAKFEQSFADQFDVILVNETLDKSLRKAQEIYDEFKAL